MAQLEIGTHLILIDVILRLLGFLEIVAPVPTSCLEVATLLLDLSIDVGQLLFRLR